MDSLVVVLDGPLVLAQVVIGESPVDVSQIIVRIEQDSLVVVLDGSLVMAKRCIGPAAVAVR